MCNSTYIMIPACGHIAQVQASARDMDCQNILDILLGSLLDHPEECGAENEMRYKLIIDSSEDGSLVRLLFSTGVLERGKTRVYMCSDFPGDAQLQKVSERELGVPTSA